MSSITSDQLLNTPQTHHALLTAAAYDIAQGIAMGDVMHLLNNLLIEALKALSIEDQCLIFNTPPDQRYNLYVEREFFNLPEDSTQS